MVMVEKASYSFFGQNFDSAKETVVQIVRMIQELRT
jgi:hypothetical protein